MKAKITIPNVNERKHVHVINPCAGDGRLFEAVKKAAGQTGETVRFTEKAGDTESICREECLRDPFVHLVLYGGDGTVHEGVNGIMGSGRNETASFSVIPAGSGNDYSAYVNGAAGFTPPDLHRLDVIRVTGGEAGPRYCANTMNMGFDSQVVMAADVYKHQKGLRGSAAYIAGVVSVLLRKKPVSGRVVLEGVRDFAAAADRAADQADDLAADRGLRHTWDGDRVTIEGDMLLCECANGPFCGGGFRSAPLCSMEDGFMDMLVIRDLTRSRFVSMIGKYRDGSYISPDGVMDKRYRGVLEYYQCKAVRFHADERYCLDGEVCGKALSIRAELLPHALWFAAL